VLKFDVEVSIEIILRLRRYLFDLGGGVQNIFLKLQLL
jgi:hypothetical protein